MSAYWRNLSAYWPIHPSTGVTVSLSNCSGFKPVSLLAELVRLLTDFSPEGAE